MKDNKPRLEQRKFKRISIIKSVKYSLITKENSSDATINYGVSINLSIGGIRIDGAVAGNIGDVVKLEFSLEKKDEPIVAFAEIKWIKEIEGTNQFGLEFLALKENDIKSIDKMTD